MNIKRPLISLSFIAAALVLMLQFSCGGSTSQAPSQVEPITGMPHLQNIITNSGDTLLMFDLYADWCGPCKMLAPILSELAAQQAGRVRIYKIDTEKYPDIAQAFRVTGIPFVAFFQSGKYVHNMTGLNPKEAYLRVIDYFNKPAKKETDQEPSGDLVRGERVIRLKYGMKLGELYAYRGDTVRLIIEDVTDELEMSIPELGVKEKTADGTLQLTFKAKETGIYKIFCNGKCPEANGNASITVMQYEGEDEGQFSELTARQAKELLEKEKPFLLDVRTPSEYYFGHLEGATLIPLQELEERLSEIAKYKNKAILVYCRSGNRSTVAADILIRAGFKKIYNLRPGIRGWQREDYPVVK
jgi:thioredoxin